MSTLSACYTEHIYLPNPNPLVFSLVDWFFKRSNEQIRWVGKILVISVSTTISLTIYTIPHYIPHKLESQKDGLTSVQKKKNLIISLSLSYTTEVIFRIFHDTPYFYPFLHSKVNRSPLFCKDLIWVFPASVPHPVESQTKGFLFTLFSCLSN